MCQWHPGPRPQSPACRSNVYHGRYSATNSSKAKSPNVQIIGPIIVDISKARSSSSAARLQSSAMFISPFRSRSKWARSASDRQICSTRRNSLRFRFLRLCPLIRAAQSQGDAARIWRASSNMSAARSDRPTSRLSSDVRQASPTKLIESTPPSQRR